MKVTIKVFLKQIKLFLVAIARHAQSTQTASLQYLKKEGRHEFDFLHAAKQFLLQIGVIIIGERG